MRRFPYVILLSIAVMSGAISCSVFNRTSKKSVRDVFPKRIVFRTERTFGPESKKIVYDENNEIIPENENGIDFGEDDMLGVYTKFCIEVEKEKPEKYKFGVNDRDNQCTLIYASDILSEYEMRVERGTQAVSDGESVTLYSFVIRYKGGRDGVDYGGLSISQGEIDKILEQYNAMYKRFLQLYHSELSKFREKTYTANDHLRDKADAKLQGRLLYYRVAFSRAKGGVVFRALSYKYSAGFSAEAYMKSIGNRPARKDIGANDFNMARSAEIGKYNRELLSTSFVVSVKELSAAQLSEIEDFASMIGADHYILK